MHFGPRLSLSNIPTNRALRALMLAVLMNGAATTSGCIPYPNRITQQTDASTPDASDGAVDAGDTGMPMDSGIDSDIIMPDGGMDAEIADAGDAGLDASLDSGVDSGIDGGMIDAGDMMDAGPVDGGTDAGTDAGMSDSGMDAGSFSGPCTTSLTIGGDIILPVTPAPGIAAPFGVARGRDGRLNVVHLSGGHLYFTSVSADGRTAMVPTVDVNPDLATMETGSNIAIACSTVADQCIVPYVRSAPGDLVTVRINPLTGARVGSEAVLNAMTNLNPYQIVYNELNNTYGLVYAQIAGATPYQAFISVTNNDGGLIRTTGLATVAAGTRAAQPTVVTLPLATSYMVAWQDSIGGNNELYTRRFNAATGASASSADRLTFTATESLRPSFRVVRSFGEYRLDWLETGVNIHTTDSTSGGLVGPPTRLAVPRADTASFLHSAEQFVAWNSGSEFDISLLGETFTTIISTQLVETSVFANFRPQVVSTGPVTAKVIFMNTDGNLHIRDLSCL